MTYSSIMIKNLEKSDISNMVKAYNESNAEAFGKYLSQCSVYLHISKNGGLI